MWQEFGVFQFGVSHPHPSFSVQLSAWPFQLFGKPVPLGFDLAEASGVIPHKDVDVFPVMLTGNDGAELVWFILKVSRYILCQTFVPSATDAAKDFIERKKREEKKKRFNLKI